jgi:hypothetical protein
MTPAPTTLGVGASPYQITSVADSPVRPTGRRRQERAAFEG